MFLRNKGASERFTFDVIYSCLQKSMRRGDYALSLEMVKEFQQYPNALKKRLIYNCCEDCPNIYLVRDIYNTPAEIDRLAPFVKIICEHIKCREVIMTFRVACQEPFNTNPITHNDDLLTSCTKLFTQLCKTNDDCAPVLNSLIEQFPELRQFKLPTIFNFINKNRLVLYLVIAYLKIDYITNEHYGTLEPIHVEFNFNHDLTIPEYVYDKHTREGPAEHKTYEFFINNIILNPRQPKTQLELKGEELYITTNQASGYYIHTRQVPDDNEQPTSTIASSNLPRRLGNGRIVTIKRSQQMKNNNYHQINNNNLLMVNKSSTVITSNNGNETVEQQQQQEPEQQKQQRIPINPLLRNYQLIQTQLLTSAHKPQTWFYELDKILKGPCSSNLVRMIINSDYLKHKFNLTHCDVRTRQIGDEVYLIMNNLIMIDPTQTTIKSSRLETNVTIYNGPTHMLKHADFPNYTDEIKIEVFKCLMFRKLIGATDTCERNIIVNPETNVVATIDDPMQLAITGYAFKTKLNEQRAHVYQTEFARLHQPLQTWLNFVQRITPTLSEIPADHKQFILNSIDYAANLEF